MNVAALGEAARKGNIEEVHRLLDKGTTTRTRDSNGHSILHIALLNGHADIARLLIEYGADIHTDTYDGYAPLHFAAAFCPASVPLLLEKGANANAQGNLFTPSPLEFAILIGNAEGVAALIEGGANVNMPTPHKKTALHKAVAVNRASIVKVLLDHGADIDYADTDGTTALHIAATRDIDILALLLERGANTRVIDVGGRTPLHVAASMGRTEAAALLLAISPELAEIPDGNGYLPQLENCPGIQEAVLRMASTTVAKFAARRRLEPTVGWQRRAAERQARYAAFMASSGSGAGAGSAAAAAGAGSAASAASAASGAGSANSFIPAIISIDKTPSQRAYEAAIRRRLNESKGTANAASVSASPRRRTTRSRKQGKRMSRKRR